MTFKVSKEPILFKMCSVGKLPFEAEEVKLFMVSGDSSIYVIPISEFPSDYIISKIE